MVSTITLEKYIELCKEVLDTSDKMRAASLEKEIVAVLRTEYKGLTQGLENYGPGVLADREIDFLGDIRLLQARLRKELEAIQPVQVARDLVREKKIFISHATKDKDYVGAIVSLLESLGFREDEIICSSIPPYCIPLDNKVYEWLVNEFQKSDLHVIYVLSKTYYTRPACLNEMGAAWAMKQKWTAILLPGFGFSDIDGCIDKTQVSIKLDDPDKDTLRFRLEEFKNNLIAEFGLRPVEGFLWEKKRNEFLDAIADVNEIRTTEPDDDGEDEREKTEEPSYTPTAGQYDVGNIPTDSAFLLVYAASENGQIMKIKILGAPVRIIAAGKQFQADDSPRESARWQEALDRLILWGWVKPVGQKGEIFELTGTGYAKADWLKEGMGINTDNEPLDERKEFD